MFLCNAAFAFTPSVPVIPGDIHLTYHLRSVSPAVPANIIDEAIKTANIKYKDRPDLQDILDYYDSKRKGDVYEATAEYWSAKGGKVRWQRDVDEGILITASDGSRCTRAMLPVASKVSKAHSMQIFSMVDTWNTERLLWEIPFLGFQQPTKQYRSDEASKIKKIAYGWVESCKVKSPYGNDIIDAVLIYDKLGRITRLRIGKTDIHEFRDFARLPNGAYYPKTIVDTSRGTLDAGSRKWPVIYTSTLTVKAVDIRPIPAETFTLNHPPAGVSITDFRYSRYGAPVLSYIYDGKKTIDAASKALCPPDMWQPGNKPIDFTLESLDGKQVKLSDYRGKVVVLSLWGYG